VSIELKTPAHTAPAAAPLYGEAAAIYAMYQRTFIERDRARDRERLPPPPRNPRGGLLARLAAAVSSQLRVPAFAQ
jgi:hypothetical protein